MCVLTCLLLRVASVLRFFFFKVCSPTPLVFSYVGFWSISTLDLLRVRRTFCACDILVVPCPCLCPPFYNILRLGFLKFLGVYDWCPTQGPDSTLTSVKRLLSRFYRGAPFFAYLLFPGLQFQCIVFLPISASASQGITKSFTGGVFPLIFLAFLWILL